jgi:hypothetical protein
MTWHVANVMMLVVSINWQKTVLNHVWRGVLATVVKRLVEQARQVPIRRPTHLLEQSFPPFFATHISHYTLHAKLSFLLHEA